MLRDPRTPVVDDLQAITRYLENLQAQLDVLKAPSGTQQYQAVAKLTALVTDIQAQLNAYIAAGVFGSGTFSGNVSVAGSLTLGGSVSGPLRVPDAVAFNITGTRRAAYLEDATGRLGYAPSNEASKVDVRPADIDLAALLAIEPKTYRYRDEVAKRAEDADYPVRDEVGLLAEDVDKVAPWAVTRDADGAPEGVDYAALAPALLAALRDQDRRLSAIERGLRGISVPRF